jgi:hypothetical protein
VNIFPFPHAFKGNKVFAAESFHLVIALDCLPVGMIAIPDIDKGDKIRTLIIKHGMHPIGFAGIFSRPFSGVLNAERSSDNCNRGDATLLFGFNQHARQSGVQRNPGHQPPFLRQLNPAARCYLCSRNRPITRCPLLAVSYFSFRIPSGA